MQGLAGHKEVREGEQWWLKLPIPHHHPTNSQAQPMLSRNPDVYSLACSNSSFPSHMPIPLFTMLRPKTWSLFYPTSNPSWNPSMLPVRPLSPPVAVNLVQDTSISSLDSCSGFLTGLYASTPTSFSLYSSKRSFKIQS